MKSLTSSLKHFVVQKLRVSNKEAIDLILAGKVLVNGSKGNLSQALRSEDIVELAGQVLKQPEEFIYLAYHKPRGIESTLNPEITGNLAQALNLNQRVFPVGRLDKESEGLMLLTNNGKIFDRIIHAESQQEKEYDVTVDKPLTPHAIAQLAVGVVIMGEKTRPAIVQQVDTASFTITLTQGLNRQIRRMCYKLGYEVVSLVRTRIINLRLGTLSPGEWRHLTSSEYEELLKAVEKPASLQ